MSYDSTKIINVATFISAGVNVLNRQFFQITVAKIDTETRKVSVNSIMYRINFEVVENLCEYT